MAQEVKSPKKGGGQKKTAKKKSSTSTTRKSPKKSSRSKSPKKRSKSKSGKTTTTKATAQPAKGKKKRSSKSGGGSFSLGGMFKAGKTILPVALAIVAIGVASGAAASTVAPRKEGGGVNFLAPVLAIGLPLAGAFLLKKFTKVKVNPNLVAGAALAGATVAALSDKLLPPILSTPGLGHVASFGGAVGTKVKGFMPQGVGRLLSRSAPAALPNAQSTRPNTTTSPARRGISGMDDVFNIRRLNHATS